MLSRMADAFRAVDAKIRLAEKRLIDLKLAVHAWTKANPVHVIHEHDPKTGWHVLRGEHVPDLPDEWAALLGELAYNLRAALNQTVELLIRANQKTSERVNQFPIIGKVKDTHLLATQLAGVHPDAVRLIEDQQPYKRPNRANPEPLEVIAGLSNMDKHTDTAAVAVLSAPWDVRWVKMVVGQQLTIKESAVRVGEGDPISDTDLFAMRVIPPNAVLHMEMQPIASEVAFHGGALPLRKVADLVTVARSVIQPLRPFVTNPPPPA